MRHPGDEFDSISRYVSYGGTNITLQAATCICVSCYLDYKRNGSNRSAVPYWKRITAEMYTLQKHCILCCETSSQCECDKIEEWAANRWFGDESLETCTKFMLYSGIIPHVNPHAKHLCRYHYKAFSKSMRERKCCMCAVKWTEGKQWKLNSRPDATSGNVPLSWICDLCDTTESRQATLTSILDADKDSTDPILRKRAEIANNILSSIRKNGVAYVLPVIDEFRCYLRDLHLMDSEGDVAKQVKSFSQFVFRLCDSYQYASYSRSTKLGKVYYDKTFSERNIPYVYDLLVKQYKLQKEMRELSSSKLSESKIRQMIREQVAMFPTSSSTFDYRSFVNQDGSMNENELNALFSADLELFINQITTSETSKWSQQSTLYKDLRKLRIRMIIALLCFCMDPRCCFIQTLLGLFAYTNGLRDAGFNILNACGCICSIDQVRKHGSFWVARRNAAEELVSNSSLWRISIDNLNFKIKFAKNLICDGGPKKMLNLITAQVVTRADPKEVSTVPTLRHLGQRVVNAMIPCVSLHPSSVTPDDFTVSPESPRDSYWYLFLTAVFVSTKNRLFSSPLQAKDTFVASLQKYMPHFTPPQQDNIVFATVDEAHSAQVHAVDDYLMKLKRDLCIGEPGYPSHVILCGDQQTWALMKSLKEDHAVKYNWFTCVPGDWHALKLSSEVIRDMLWDGGLKECSKVCGHNSDKITQWQDLHNMLLSYHEVLMRKAVSSFIHVYNGNFRQECGSAGFWKWREYLASDSNKDEVSRHNAAVLLTLTSYLGYYFSIRSGNWLLRLSSMKVLSHLFFAYRRYKYEELSMCTIFQSLTLPQWILDKFVDGEWVVSVKGQPYKNLAIDEAHECVINRRLKQITSRPSHFRTVQLANFMAYLDTVLNCFESYIFRYKSVSSLEYVKRYTSQRAERLTEFMTESLFEFSESRRPLCNVYRTNATQLDSQTVKDLLTYNEAGNCRMIEYVKQNITPSTQPPPKKKHPKLKTFTLTKSTRKQQDSQIRAMAVIIRNSYVRAQAKCVPVMQVSPYPLAIAYPSGQMRSPIKSSFKAALAFLPDFNGIFTNFCPFSTASFCNVCIVIDFLLYLHMPPPYHVTTFTDFSRYLWGVVVNANIAKHNGKHVLIVIDKPKYLPPPRQLVHANRSEKSGRFFGNIPEVQPSGSIPKGSEYSSALCISDFKSQLIQFLTKEFISFAISASQQSDVTFGIDSPSVECPLHIVNGSISQCTANQHGEADYAIWHHAINNRASNVLVVSGDTDCWVYGLGLMEAGWLRGKCVIVKRGISGEYVNINLGVNVISQFEPLVNLQHPVASMVALYVLSGCDYVSSFFRQTKARFMACFMSNIDYICSHSSNLVEFDEDTCRHKVYKGINVDAWLRFVSSVYLVKHKKCYDPQSIGSFRESFASPPLSAKCRLQLGRVGLHGSESLPTIRDWCKFIRCLNFHTSEPSKDHEANILPSYGALIRHCKRSAYVLDLVYSSPFLTCNNLNNVQQFGWVAADDSISIDWDEASPEDLVVVPKACGCKASGCMGRCSCFSAKRGCGLKCKCHDTCRNPFNSTAHPAEQSSATLPSVTQPPMNHDEKDDGDESDTDVDDRLTDSIYTDYSDYDSDS